MNTSHTDRLFAGSIPQLYEQYLVPLIFEPYAVDMAARVAALRPARVLEVAAGTGVLTRRLAARLPPEAALVASDLNEPMLDHAAAIGTARPVQWQQADAMSLPFPDASFDVVVCQFGVMFFPDRALAMAEARRVLRPGGSFLFSAWDAIEHNEFADVVIRALAALFPARPPQFLARLPHGYHEQAQMATDLARAGFAAPAHFSTLGFMSRAASPCLPATAYCQGTPLRNEIEAIDGNRLEEATQAAEAAIAAVFGSGPVEGRIQAVVVEVAR
ncbi:class I SAM-dependent methyltransferase [Paucibacter soli]|uniref:class I SAM-dependent methyltransferase n=1 Tax=Paucibacter soli TaxID=3133433 RepID=UPI0030990081